MNHRIRKAAQARSDRRAQYRNSIHYAINHASSASERNDLTMLASAQGVLI